MEKSFSSWKTTTSGLAWPRLLIMSNFGDGNSGAGNRHTRVQNLEETPSKRTAKKFQRPFSQEVIFAGIT